MQTEDIDSIKKVGSPNRHSFSCYYYGHHVFRFMLIVSLLLIMFLLYDHTVIFIFLCIYSINKCVCMCVCVCVCVCVRMQLDTEEATILYELQLNLSSVLDNLSVMFGTR